MPLTNPTPDAPAYPSRRSLRTPPSQPDNTPYPRRRDLREPSSNPEPVRRRDLRTPSTPGTTGLDELETTAVAAPLVAALALPQVGSPAVDRPFNNRPEPAAQLLPLPQTRPLRRAATAVRRVQASIAMTFIGLLAVTIAIPAAAAPGANGPLPTSSGWATQTLVANGAAVAVQRDGYSVTEAPPPPPPPPVVVPAASNVFARTADTFTNNPLSPIQWPFTTGVPISDGFGPRTAPCSGCSSYHKGLDMNPGQGSPIQVVAEGVVTVAQSSDNGGLGVYAEIEHVIDGQRITSVYGHMLEGSLQLTEGQVVTVGQQVGNVGNTGTSTGAHLHFEIHADGSPIDPYSWMSDHVLP